MTAHNKLSQANLTESVKHKVVLSKKGDKHERYQKLHR